jgi:hypothetical protein
MLSNLLLEFQSLGPSQTPQLVATLVACGVILVISGHRLAVMAFLVQRLMVIALLQFSLGLPMTAMLLVASIAAGLLYLLAEGRLLVAGTMRCKRLIWPAWPLKQVPLRALTAGLGLLLIYALVGEYTPDWLPLTASATASSLLVTGVLVLILANSGVQTGIGVQTFMDAGRIIYALRDPQPIIWGLWAAFDVIVALAASYLQDRGVDAT